MCLTVSKKNTEKFKSKHRNHKKVTVWKVVEYVPDAVDYYSHYHTIYMSAYVNKGWYKSHYDLINANMNRIYGGVIHVFSTKNKAEAEIAYVESLTNPRVTSYVILKCTALMEDFIAAGENKDLCFRKIWVPKTQVPLPKHS